MPSFVGLGQRTSRLAFSCRDRPVGGRDGGATPVWRTDAQWAVSVIQGLLPSTSYTFAVKARNLASVQTAFGPSATLSTLTP